MLEVRGVVVRYGALAAVDGVDLDVAPGHVAVVLGPSGCGKSTLLRAIVGLEPLDAGSVRWDDADITHTPVHERHVGMMFQDHALFPHLDVATNVAFGMKMEGTPRGARADRVGELLDLVGLPGFEERRVDELSGGEAQRVALARALAPKPRVLLLDEPLSSVDRDRRDQLVADLRTIVRTTGTAAIHVTHDHDEALAIADELIVMNKGTIEQRGAPAAVWNHPATPFVGGFLGANVVHAAILGADEEGEVSIPPDAIRIDRAGPLRATLVNRAFQRDHERLEVRTGRGVLLTVWHRPDSGEPTPAPGDEVRLEINEERITHFPK